MQVLYLLSFLSDEGYYNNFFSTFHSMNWVLVQNIIFDLCKTTILCLPRRNTFDVQQNMIWISIIEGLTPTNFICISSPDS